MSNIMIDIETLGTLPTSVILSIGAVEFDENGVGKTFYTQINPESCADYGLTMDARTVMWWLEQDEAARRALINAKNHSLDVALEELAAAFDWKNKSVWANGIDFDLSILENAYRAVGKNAPWPYWAKMDYRTLKKMVPREVYESCKEEPVVAHDALCDAVAQAATTIQLTSWVHRNMEHTIKGKKRGSC